MKGKPYEKVTYDASPQQPLCDCSTDSHVNSITLSVRDQDSEPFDFDGLPLTFQLEISLKYTMSSTNVLPSAPQEQIYPELPTQPDFRMQKVNEISAAFNKEVSHYRVVAKKYKRAKKAVNWTAEAPVGSLHTWMMGRSVTPFSRLPTKALRGGGFQKWCYRTPIIHVCKDVDKTSCS